MFSWMLKLKTTQRHRHKQDLLAARYLDIVGLIPCLTSIGLIKNIILNSHHHEAFKSSLSFYLFNKYFDNFSKNNYKSSYREWDHTRKFFKQNNPRLLIKTRSRRRCLFSSVARGLRFGLGRLYLIRESSRGGDFGLGLARWLRWFQIYCRLVLFSLSL